MRFTAIYLLCSVVLFFGAGCAWNSESEQPIVTSEDLACDKGLGSGPPTKEMGVCRLLHASVEGKFPKKIHKAQAEVLVDGMIELGALSERVDTGEVNVTEFQQSFEELDKKCTDWVGLGCAELFFNTKI